MGNPNYHHMTVRSSLAVRISRKKLTSVQSLWHVPLLPEPAGGSGDLPLQPLSAAPLSENRKRMSASGISIKNSRKPWGFSIWIRPMVRDLNAGFSGGEKRKRRSCASPLKSILAILDETDSGLDVDAVRTVSKETRSTQKSKGRRTPHHHHSTEFSLSPCGQDPCSRRRPPGCERAMVLVDEINENGFEQFIASVNEKGENNE